MTEKTKEDAPSLEDKPAVQTEAEGSAESVTLEWDGLELTLPASVEEWDPAVLEGFEQGKFITALRALLGSDAYDALGAAFKRKNKRVWKMRDLNEVGAMVAKHYGFGDQGE